MKAAVEGCQTASEGAAELNPRVALSRRPPDPERLDALLEKVDPDGTVAGVRRLRGGISSRTFEVTYLDVAGLRESFVLRIAVPENYHSDPASVERHWKTLRALEATDVPAPRPLLLDLAGEYFGAPAIVMSTLPGSPPVLPSRRDLFIRRLAEGLVKVHRVDVRDKSFSHLELWHRDEIIAKLRAPIDPKLEEEPLGVRVWQALKDSVDGIDWLGPTLTHDDFWPGNTVWHRGRLSGIVDWSTAERGDPRNDVAQCRVDLALMYGLDWADGFAAEYERAAGRPLPQLWFWDLYRGRSALTSLHYYWDGYADLGLEDQSLEERRGRLTQFLTRALELSRRRRYRAQ